MVNDLTVSSLLKGKTLLIFDFDGTLANTGPLHAKAFKEILEPHGITVDYPAIAGMKTADAIQKCLLSIGLNLSEVKLDELVTAKQNYVRELIQKQLLPLPGVDAFLRWAKTRYRLALYSSGSRGTVELSLRKLGYTDWFDPMLCAEDVKVAKPSPEGFKKILQVSKISANFAIVFEDSEAGLLAATRASLDVVDVNPPFCFSSLVASL
jgi:HAD superfamily hydrolase (TIGR01509 family)